MKKLFLLLFVATVAISCSNPLKKSIVETLTADELARIEKNNSEFMPVYTLLQSFKDSLLKDEAIKKMWEGITYKRVDEFIKYMNDTSSFNKVKDSLHGVWEQQYGQYSHKVDSVLAYWKSYREANDASQYVKIELENIDKEYYPYSNKLNNVSFEIKVTPLRGPVDYLRFSYKVIPRSAIDRAKSDYDIYHSSLYEASRCTITERFSGPLTNYWEANYTNRKILEERNIETFKRDFVVYFEVDELRQGGKRITKSNVDVPASVLNYWKNENDPVMKEKYAKDIVKDILGVDFVSEQEFYNNAFEKYIENKDKEVYELLKLCGYRQF